MSDDFKATINPESERAQAWLKVFGSHEIALCSPIPQWASAPGVPKGLFYFLDLNELTPEQRERLIVYISHRFQVDEQEVRETLDAIGCPILDEDVTVTVYHPLKWV